MKLFYYIAEAVVITLWTIWAGVLTLGHWILDRLLSIFSKE